MSSLTASKKALRNYSFLKGRLAEALIERLFITLGMEVYPVGFEAKLPRIAQLKSFGKIKPHAIERFEFGPDFIMCRKSPRDEHNYEIFEIEVKYRKDSAVTHSEINKYKDENIYFIFLSRTEIFCVQKKEIVGIQKQKKSTELDFNKLPYLADHPAFGFSKRQKRIISIFQDLITATLNNFTPDAEIKKVMGKKYGESPEIYDAFFKGLKRK